MNRRLEQFLAAENISQSQFADKIGVARASVSHILAGRNKPGFDFIESMSRHFPSLNIEWLILGNGKMYKSPAVQVQEIPSTPQQEPLSDNLFEDSPSLEETPLQAVEATPLPLPELLAPKCTSNESRTATNRHQSSKNQRNITKIIVFYDDNTYQELK